MRKKDSYISAIGLMGIFTFLFLCTEYLYVDMIAKIVSENQTVAAQNYALGVSAAGFILYSVLKRICKKMWWKVGTILSLITAGICMGLICYHTSYEVTLWAGFLLFLLFGIYGSAVYYKAMCLIQDYRYLARIAGSSYMFGILLQFLNNNLVSSEIAEAVVLFVFLILLVYMMIKMDSEDGQNPAVLMQDNETGLNKSAIENISENNTEGYVRKSSLENNENKSAVLGGILIVLVVLMSCVFSTLDNAVTLVHATGAFDIGQLPRVLLAVSGVLAGFLFDIQERKFMTLMMYCLMMLSTICIAVFQFSGPFLTGLIVFYMTAGFFVVFFTTSFMEISRYMKVPELWAGLGRAVNNITAALITGVSLKLLSSGGNITFFVLVIIVFVAVSIVAALYIIQRNRLIEAARENVTAQLSAEEKLKKIKEEFSLTPREEETFRYLVTTEDSIQEIAEKMYVSKRTLERHISSIYEKTGIKSRVGLINIYNRQ